MFETEATEWIGSSKYRLWAYHAPLGSNPKLGYVWVAQTDSNSKAAGIADMIVTCPPQTARNRI